MKNNGRKTSTLSKSSGPDDLPTNDQLIDEAARIDAARANQDKANPVDQVIGGGDAAGGAAPTEEHHPTADPAIVMSLTFLVSTGVRVLHERFDWTNPTDEWKNQVATLGAIVIDKYIPDLLRSQGEVMALVLCVAPYVIENVMRKSGGSDGDPGDQGKRENNFVEPVGEDALTRAAHPS